MHWTITKDLIDGGTTIYIGRHPKALKNLDNTNIQRFEEWIKALPYEFRLLDGDEEVYFIGRCEDLAEADADHAFAPLDWAQGNYGCVEMQYRKVGEKEWVVL